MTIDQLDTNRRWADIARRTNALGPGTTALVEAAMRQSVPYSPLDAAERRLDQLEAERR